MPSGRIQKPRPSKTAEVQTSDGPKGDSQQAEEVSADLDAILDEIDSLLDQNALEMAQLYIQRGGE